MIGIKGNIDRVAADGEDLLHVSDTIFEDKNSAVVGDRLHATRWGETVNVAIK